MANPPTIGVVAGDWSTNIGNSFFDLGAVEVLARLYPEARVLHVPDSPSYAGVNKSKPSNSEWLIDRLELDAVVILGPLIRPEFTDALLPTLQRLAARKVRLGALGIGMMKYSHGDFGKAIDGLASLPFSFFATRDEDTAKATGGKISCPVYNGIDLGFYMNDVYPAPKVLESEPYIALNFDVTPEPAFLEADSSSAQFEFEGKGYRLKFPEWRTKKCHSSVLYSLFDRAFMPQNVVDRVMGYQVLRSDHRFNPIIRRKVFCRPHTVSADQPWGYLSLYRSCLATFSNRVHACVVTLAYGNQAMLFSGTPRAKLLEKVGLGDITSKPVSLAPDRLLEEKAGLEEYLRKTRFDF